MASKDIPIIFSAPMVRALLEGRKTQTRRILKPQPEPFKVDGDVECEIGVSHLVGEPRPRLRLGNVVTTQTISYGVGDRLWVRENIWQASPYPGTLPSGEPDESCRWSSRLVFYSADGNPPNTPNRHYPNGFREGCGAFSAPDPYVSWLQRPSIHMPRWASRLTLICEGVKVERLQDISEEAAKAEGVKPIIDHGCGSAPMLHRIAFEQLWENLHGAGSWIANPFVVAPSFRVIKANIDAPEARAA